MSGSTTPSSEVKVYRTAVAAGRVADSARRLGANVIILPVRTGYIIVRIK